MKTIYEFSSDMIKVLLQNEWVMIEIKPEEFLTFKLKEELTQKEKLSIAVDLLSQVCQSKP